MGDEKKMVLKQKPEEILLEYLQLKADIPNVLKGVITNCSECSKLVAAEQKNNPLFLKELYQFQEDINKLSVERQIEQLQKNTAILKFLQELNNFRPPEASPALWSILLSVPQVKPASLS